MNTRARFIDEINQQTRPALLAYQQRLRAKTLSWVSLFKLGQNFYAQVVMLSLTREVRRAKPRTGDICTLIFDELHGVSNEWKCSFRITIRQVGIRQLIKRCKLRVLFPGLFAQRERAPVCVQSLLPAAGLKQEIAVNVKRSRQSALVAAALVEFLYFVLLRQS